MVGIVVFVLIGGNYKTVSKKVHGQTSSRTDSFCFTIFSCSSFVRLGSGPDTPSMTIGGPIFTITYKFTFVNNEFCSINLNLKYDRRTMSS